MQTTQKFNIENMKVTQKYIYEIHKSKDEFTVGYLNSSFEEDKINSSITFPDENTLNHNLIDDEISSRRSSLRKRKAIQHKLIQKLNNDNRKETRKSIGEKRESKEIDSSIEVDRNSFLPKEHDSYKLSSLQTENVAEDECEQHIPNGIELNSEDHSEDSMVEDEKSLGESSCTKGKLIQDNTTQTLNGENIEKRIIEEKVKKIQKLNGETIGKPDSILIEKNCELSKEDDLNKLSPFKTEKVACPNHFIDTQTKNFLTQPNKTRELNIQYKQDIPGDKSEILRKSSTRLESSRNRRETQLEKIETLNNENSNEIEKSTEGEKDKSKESISTISETKCEPYEKNNSKEFETENLSCENQQQVSYASELAEKERINHSHGLTAEVYSNVTKIKGDDKESIDSTHQIEVISNILKPQEKNYMLANKKSNFFTEQNNPKMNFENDINDIQENRSITLSSSPTSDVKCTNIETSSLSEPKDSQNDRINKEDKEIFENINTSVLSKKEDASNSEDNLIFSPQRKSDRLKSRSESTENSSSNQIFKFTGLNTSDKQIAGDVQDVEISVKRRRGRPRKFEKQEETMSNDIQEEDSANKTVIVKYENIANTASPKDINNILNGKRYDESLNLKKTVFCQKSLKRKRGVSEIENGRTSIINGLKDQIKADNDERIMTDFSDVEICDTTDKVLKKDDQNRGDIEKDEYLSDHNLDIPIDSNESKRRKLDGGIASDNLSNFQGNKLLKIESLDNKNDPEDNFDQKFVLNKENNEDNYYLKEERKQVSSVFYESVKANKEKIKISKQKEDKNYTNGYLDFGYDTNRRTSFRKILERVMEASKLEMDTSLRRERCKSVPNENFCSDNTTNLFSKSYSADFKLKYLHEKIRNVNGSKAKKCLDFGADLVMIKRRKSTYLSGQNEEQTPGQKIGTTEDGLIIDDNHDESIAVAKDFVMKQTGTSELNILEQEVECFTLTKAHNDVFYGRERCKSVLKIGQKKRGRPKSSLGKRLQTTSTAVPDGYVGPTVSQTLKKAYEFKVGDIVWSKIGSYPYWPGLIVEDPETSEYKKFKLLRSTPYYHVRFFGDKGKRAWALHSLPYEGPDDLNILIERGRKEGVQVREFVVKYSHREKWNKAVSEAEMIKNDTLEHKMSFFDRLLSNGGGSGPTIEQKDFKSTNLPEEKNLTRDGSKSITSLAQLRTLSKPKGTTESPKVPMKISFTVACIEKDAKQREECLKSSPTKDNKIKKASLTSKTAENVRDEDRTEVDTPSKSPTKRRSVPMKDSSVLSCIDHVVNKYCSENPGKGRLKQKKRPKEDQEPIDLGLELLHLDMAQPENVKVSSPVQLTPKTTPVSSRKELKKARSKSSLNLGRRRLSQEFNMNIKEVSQPSNEPLCSPRLMKLKRRTIDVYEKTGDSSNEIVSRLPEYKKNLFRGVPKERVCQICEKPGDVMKCRGPCNGDYHANCIEKYLKDTEKLIVQNTSVDKNEQVEISTVLSRKELSQTVILSPVNTRVPMMEQFDRKMKELMSAVESGISVESNEFSSEEIGLSLKNNNRKASKKRKSFKHVTADDVREINLMEDITKSKSEITDHDDVYKCPFCTSTVIPPCFVCNSVVSKKGNLMRQRCSLQKCGKYYHLECLNVWHQTQWSFILHDKKKSEALDSFVCPRHSCHICTSENSGFSMGRCPNDKLVKCLRCPATYHNSYHCVPAGTDILTSTQIICPRHVEGNKKSNTLNTVWCFVCSEGGNLICCETCPTSVHSECLQVNLLDDDTYICEDCESGRFPLYDEVVWVKCGSFRWWPAVILFPSEVPANIEGKPHSKGEFVVKFFGTYNYFWVGRGKTFLYQEGDTGYLNNTKSKIDEAFSTALREAADVYKFKKGLREKKQKEVNNGLKPPPYIRIKVNRPVGNVKVFEGNLSNTTPCDCDPKDKSPCGPNSNCLNRILLTECNPEICPAGQRCRNQSFEKREYPQVVPYRTTHRGWGLKTLEPLKKGRFVIEYVGEVIDDEEYQRRITRMHQQKDENYYFLTIDKDRMLDAGPKGNVARFMNHSCQPNCETQKWTVNGDTRVGLFAIKDIPVDCELTFNYNLECVGTEKKICRCGAPNCSGFIGVKPEDQKPTKKSSSMKTVEPEKLNDLKKELCFICGKGADVGKCANKTCLRSYHLECVQLDSWPIGKWNCPSHVCNICTKRTSRICVLCNNSYCPYHADGNIRYDESLGFLCNDHNQSKKNGRRSNRLANGTVDSASTSALGTPKEEDKNVLSRSERYRKRTSCSEIENPPKRIKLDE